jgi:hypothetical protein
VEPVPLLAPRGEPSLLIRRRAFGLVEEDLAYPTAALSLAEPLIHEQIDDAAEPASEATSPLEGADAPHDHAEALLGDLLRVGPPQTAPPGVGHEKRLVQPDELTPPRCVPEVAESV